MGKLLERSIAGSMPALRTHYTVCVYTILYILYIFADEKERDCVEQALKGKS